ncbi:hypothetical protein Tco_0425332 [Tanacetum coccineum]
MMNINQDYPTSSRTPPYFDSNGGGDGGLKGGLDQRFLSRIMNQEQILTSDRVEAFVSIADKVQNAFLITADVPEIYMQQFRLTVKKVKKSSFYQFDLDDKKFQVDVKLFLKILRICLSVPDKEFVAPPSPDLLVTFLKELVTRSGSYVTIIKDDVVLGILKFIGKGEETHMYMDSSYSPRYNVDMKRHELLVFIRLLLPYPGFNTPKKGREEQDEARRVYETHERLVTENPSTEEEPDEVDVHEEDRLVCRRPIGVVIRDTLHISKKKSLDQSQKLKGIQVMSNDGSIKCLVTKKETSKPAGSNRIQQQSAGSSKGAGVTPEVFDEPKGSSVAKVVAEIDWGSEDNSAQSDDTLMHVQKRMLQKGAAEKETVAKEAHKALYDALIQSIFMDEDDMDKAATSEPSTQLKRKHDDQDEDPSARSYQGKTTKKRRTKESKPSKKSSTSKETDAVVVGLQQEVLQLPM